jgi:hypothetical protein
MRRERDDTGAGVWKKKTQVCKEKKTQARRYLSDRKQPCPSRFAASVFAAPVCFGFSEYVIVLSMCVCVCVCVFVCVCMTKKTAQKSEQEGKRTYECKLFLDRSVVRLCLRM